MAHTIGNVLAALPKSAHPGAKKALAEIYNAQDREHAAQAAIAFEADYGAKWPKAVAKVTGDLDVLLAFYDFPAEHWIHLRTTNPIESTFATVRLRQRITKGPGSRAAGVAMAFKLIESAQARWRAVNAPHLVALVGAGARFEKGKLIERPPKHRKNGALVGVALDRLITTPPRGSGQDEITDPAMASPMGQHLRFLLAPRFRTPGPTAHRVTEVLSLPTEAAGRSPGVSGLCLVVIQLFLGEPLSLDPSAVMLHLAPQVLAVPAQDGRDQLGDRGRCP